MTYYKRGELGKRFPFIVDVGAAETLRLMLNDLDSKYTHVSPVGSRPALLLAIVWPDRLPQTMRRVFGELDLGFIADLAHKAGAWWPLEHQCVRFDAAVNSCMSEQEQAMLMSTPMKPLRVLARLDGPLTLRDGILRLDAILAWAEATRRELPPPSVRPMVDIEIPVHKEPRGRFHLCSFAVPRFEQHELVYVNRRFPIAEAQMFAVPEFKRIKIAAGAQKSYRIPEFMGWVERDQLEWFCTGDAEQIRGLLRLVTHLGHRRAVGRGQLKEWVVEEYEPWTPGFPVARDGKPLRALPPDWPGLIDPPTAFSTITFPYWTKHLEELCAVPEISA